MRANLKHRGHPKRRKVCLRGDNIQETLLLSVAMEVYRVLREEQAVTTAAQHWSAQQESSRAAPPFQP